MFAAPSLGATVSSNGCVMPGAPAVPKNNAYSDHSSAAIVPIEISVSMVAAPCRRFVHAALWNGHAAHTMTGPARASESHCQEVNCSAGIIAIAMTGTVRMIEATSRCLRLVSSASDASVTSPAGVFASGMGRTAV